MLLILTPALLAAAGFPAALLPAIDSDTIIFSHARPDGTLEFLVPDADEPKSAFTLVWHPEAEDTWDYSGLRFYVKEAKFRDANHYDPLGDELVSLRHDGEPETVNDLAEWLDTPEPATPGSAGVPPAGIVIKSAYDRRPCAHEWHPVTQLPNGWQDVCVNCGHHRMMPATPPAYGPDNPRFVWVVGAIREEFPDIPEHVGQSSSDIHLWDRKHRRSVAILTAAYAQAMVLETTRRHGDAPFTALADWLNDLTPEELASENLPA